MIHTYNEILCWTDYYEHVKKAKKKKEALYILIWSNLQDRLINGQYKQHVIYFKGEGVRIYISIA